jgi:ABC-type branched-subunit amino acid transport system substrate-binding protein
MIGCGRPAEPALIDYALSQSDGVRKVIGAVLDSTSRAGWYPVRLADPVSRPGGGTEMIRTVYGALASAQRADVVGAMGLAGSSHVFLAGPVYRDAGIPLVVPTANVPQLSLLGPGVFLMAPSLEEEAGFISAFVAEQLAARAVTILYNPGAWGAALQAQLAAELWQRGVPVLGPVPVPQIDCSVQDPLLPRLVAAALRLGRPDVVVLATYEACLVPEFERQAPGLTFVFGDGLVVPPTWSARQGPLARRVHAVAFRDPAAASEAAAAFTRLFTAMNGFPPTWADAAAFDAVMVMATAVREVGPSREAIARYLHQLGRGRPPYAGVTGPITFLRERTGRLTMETWAASSGAEE